MIIPNKFESQLKLAPGAHGEKFNEQIPGYRGKVDRINRTQNRLNVSRHDVLNQKYHVDKRLKALFTYGWAFGYNQFVMTKGRIVAADPYLDIVDFQTDKQFNTLTLANGGAAVKLRTTEDVFGAASPIVSSEFVGQPAGMEGREWAPLIGLDVAYSDDIPCYNALATSSSAQLTAKGYGISPRTGLVSKDGKDVMDVRPGNVPLGMIEANVYTRNQEQDAADGLQPGPVITDAIVELPFFAFKDKAEGNPWGSIYGQLKVGDLLKSDENGRLTVSPLSIDAALESMTLAQMERERQQVVGQCIGIRHDMVPEAGYQWVTWALADRLKFEGFAPDLYRHNYRDGEDIVASSAYASTGRYPGHPVDKAFQSHDLHMAGGARDGAYDKFFDERFHMDGGIPGLTDGFNAVIRDYENKNAGMILHRGSAEEYIKNYIIVNPNGNLEPGTCQVQLTSASTTEAYTNCAKDALLADGAFKVTYFNEIQGMVVIEVEDKAKADAYLLDNPVTINFKYKKRGMAGVPTFMDWDGCIGSAKILMQR